MNSRVLVPGAATLLTLGAIAYAQVTCPDGFTAPPASLSTGFCYKFLPANQNWFQHETACSQTTLNGQPYGGGHLATMFNQASATVVMDNYCNGLATAAGQSSYFIGYYICCGSTNYASRQDWRWSSTMSTTWLHGQTNYISGAEPDDLGCGRAHTSDDGTNTGKVGDYYCDRALTGGCCEAPVVPSPSSMPTRTSTRTSSETSTSTRTQSPTNTRTGTSTSTRTSSETATPTSSVTRSISPSSSPTRSSSPSPSVTTSSSVSPSVSPSTSTSVTPSVTVSETVSPSSSVSPSVSVTVTATVTPTVSISISPTPRPLNIGSLGGGGNSGSGGVGGLTGGGSGSAAAGANGGAGGANGTAAGAAGIIGSGLNVGAGYDVPPGLTAEEKVYVAAGAGAGAFLLLLIGLCCLWWFCVLVPRKKKAKEDFANRLKRKSQFAKAGRLQKKGAAQSTRMATMLGLSTDKDGNFDLDNETSATPMKSLNGKATPANSPNPLMRQKIGDARPGITSSTQSGMSSVLGAMNPALLKAKRATMTPTQGRGPRISMALSAYKNTAAFKPTTAGGLSRKSTVQQAALLEEDGNDDYDDAAIGLDDDENNNEEGQAAEGEYDYSQEQQEGEGEGYDYNNGQEGEGEGEAGADDEYDADGVDDEEAIEGIAGRRVGGKKATGGGWLSNRTKKVAETAIAPPVEDKKLVIGKGAVLTERVEKQVIMLRRVSKIKGDSGLTQLRQDTSRFARPSGAAVAFGGAGASSAGGYTFQATVSRTYEKHRKSSLAKPTIEAVAEEEKAAGEGGYDETPYYQGEGGEGEYDYSQQQEGEGEAGAEGEGTGNYNYDYEGGQYHYQQQPRTSMAAYGSS